MQRLEHPLERPPTHTNTPTPCRILCTVSLTQVSHVSHPSHVIARTPSRCTLPQIAACQQKATGDDVTPAGPAKKKAKMTSPGTTSSDAHVDMLVNDAGLLLVCTKALTIRSSRPYSIDDPTAGRVGQVELVCNGSRIATTDAEVKATRTWINDYRAKSPTSLADVLLDLKDDNGKRVVNLNDDDNDDNELTETATRKHVELVQSNAGDTFNEKLTADEAAAIQKLTVDEAAAIHLYTGHRVCYDTNTKLQDLKKHDAIEPFARLLNSALANLDDAPPCTVYRGVGVDFTNLTSWNSHFKKDNIIRWWAFTSTSRTSNMALKLASSRKNPDNPKEGPTSTHRTLFIIRCRTGKDIKKLSRFRHEDEVLIRAGTKIDKILLFRVVDIGDPGKDITKQGSSLTMVTLEEVEEVRDGPS